MYIEIGLTKKEIQKIKQKDFSIYNEILFGYVLKEDEVDEYKRLSKVTDISGNIVMCLFDINTKDLHMCLYNNYNFVLVTNILEYKILGYKDYIGK